MQAELTWDENGMVKGWDKERHEKDSLLLGRKRTQFDRKEGAAGRGTKCEWSLTDGNDRAKLGRMRRRENGDNRSHDNKHTSTNAYICDLENKANFSEAAFTTSYL